MYPRFRGAPTVHNREEDCECDGENCPSLGAVGACCTRLVERCPEARSNRGVRGTTCGSQPATPRVQLSRRRAEVRGAQPTAVAIAAVCRGARSTTYGSGAGAGGAARDLRNGSEQRRRIRKNRNHKFGCTSLLASTCHHMEIMIMKYWVREPPGNLLSRKKCQPPDRCKQIRNTSAGTKRN